MINNLKTAKILWLITALLALVAALSGIINKHIYMDVFPRDFLPGAYYQDVLTVLVSLFLIISIVFVKEHDIKKQVVILGILGFLFYLYGIFTIERVYNEFYILYAAIFAFSFWSLVYSLSAFNSDKFKTVYLSEGMRKTAATSSILISVIFTVLWIAALIPLMKEHNRIDYLYSIYILDLCFIMPAFFISAVMSLRNNVLGTLLVPAIMILGFFVIFPLGLNELAKASSGMPVDYGPMVVSFVFAFFMLTIAIVQLRMMRIE